MSKRRIESRKAVKKLKTDNQEIDLKGDKCTDNVSTSAETVDELELDTNKVCSSGEKPNMKIISWNVNGIRAFIKNGGLNHLRKESADIICFQETKCSEKDIPEEFKHWKQYPYKYYCTALKKGYSGVSLISKQKPIQIKYGIDVKEHDSEGRVITAEYNSFYLVTAYVPNAGDGLKRLDYRMSWDRDFADYLKQLDDKKPVIVCGDLNVAHKEIDLENPKTNTKTAGFTPQERENFGQLLEKGFIDSLRELYPNTKKLYTYWSYKRNARQKDIGWRLDYFLISQSIKDKLCDNIIRSKILGSDHCPIALFMTI